MSFQILNANNEPISMKELDKEACEFWGKTSDPKYYANPSEPKREGESEIDYLRRSMTSNWFDIIGYCIHTQGNYTSGWRNIVHTMISDILGSSLIGGKDDESIPVVKLRECIEVKPNGEQVKAWHLEDKVEEAIYGTLEFYKPYIELINHWQSKGYVPLQVKE